MYRQESAFLFFEGSDYYPFGLEMEGRTGSSESYRYSFNGMEKDDEVSGGGNSYTTEYRHYDPRLGRWKSLDPLMSKFPHFSPYVAFDNNPIYFVDPYGLSSEKGDKNKVTYKHKRKRNSDDHWQNLGQLPNKDVAEGATFIIKYEGEYGDITGDKYVYEEGRWKYTQIIKDPKTNYRTSFEGYVKSEAKEEITWSELERIYNNPVSDGLKTILQNEYVEKAQKVADFVDMPLTVADESLNKLGSTLSKDLTKANNSVKFLEKYKVGTTGALKKVETLKPALQVVKAAKIATTTLKAVPLVSAAVDITVAFVDPTPENIGAAAVTVAATAVGIFCVPCGLVIGLGGMLWYW